MDIKTLTQVVASKEVIVELVPDPPNPEEVIKQNEVPTGNDGDSSNRDIDESLKEVR